jgi:beta-lactamase superfamily II metal-dependent hydrolase
LGGVWLLNILPEEATATLSCTDKAEIPVAETFTLWQLQNQTGTQMMSYVIQTVHEKVIVIDGGMAGDAPFLAKFLLGLGGTVEDWFVTHAHNDHFDALAELLKQPGTLKIGAIHGSLPDAAWINQWGSDPEKESFRLFGQAMDGAGRKVEDLSVGQTMDIDGVHIDVLGVKNPEITKNAINNSSVVLRVADAAKSVLFLADLGVEGGEKLLGSPLADRLPSDYVQMAHHGQQGVSEAFYQRVRPSYCLWPTPKWLWDNDNGGGAGSGPWRTAEVRAWMDKMPVKKHYVMFEGMQKIN